MRLETHYDTISTITQRSKPITVVYSPPPAQPQQPQQPPLLQLIILAILIMIIISIISMIISD